MPETGGYSPKDVIVEESRRLSPLESPDSQLEKKKGRLSVVKEYADSIFSQAEYDDDVRDIYESEHGELYFQYVLLDKYISTVDVQKEDVLPNMNPALTRQENLSILRDSAMKIAIQNACELYDAEKNRILDELTGAWSHAALKNYINLHLREKEEILPSKEGSEEKEQLEDESLKTAVLMLDVDHFKNFNDTYGHSAGDKVLQEFVHALQGSVRANDLVARYGGEEFSLVLPRVNQKELQEITDRVLNNIRNLTVTLEDGQQVNVTASIGSTFIEDGDTDAKQPLQRADKMLYAAKESGRDRAMYDFEENIETADTDNG